MDKDFEKHVKKYKLDEEEVEILKAFEAGKLKSIPNVKEEIARLHEAAVNTLKLRKSSNLNIRLAPQTVLGAPGFRDGPAVCPSGEYPPPPPRRLRATPGGRAA